MEYRLIRSKRKRLSMHLERDGTLVVRAPMRTSRAMIDRFVEENAGWVARARKKNGELRQRAEAEGILTAEDLQRLADRAMQVIPERVRHYAPLVGVTYGRITIRNQKTRWGSCSAAGNLNFNCLLMLTPPEVIDSVVVHELCHRLEMNHSPRFYAHVYRVYPEYDRWHGWLKQNGATLLRRMTG